VCILTGCSAAQQAPATPFPTEEAADTATALPTEAPTSTPSATATQTLTATAAATATETAIPLADGVLPIPLQEPLTLGSGDLIISIVSTTTDIADVPNSLVLGVIAEATGSGPIGFGRCDIANTTDADTLGFMQAMMSGGYSCLILTTNQGDSQTVASVGVDVDGNSLARSAADLIGTYDGPDSTKIVNPGQPWGYYLIFEVPTGAVEVNVRLEHHPW
jgi:hypothetical protein